VLTLDDGQTLQIPREELAPTAEPGTAFVLQVLPADEAALEKDELARTLLNQILEHDEKVGSRVAA